MSFLIAAGVFFYSFPNSVLAVEVNTCGQVISGSGFLAGDLDCTGMSGPAVTINGGILNLRGFALSNGLNEGVACTAACQVVSNPPGGTISGFGTQGVTTLNEGSLRVSNVVIDGNGGVGVRTNGGNIRVKDSVITGNGLGVSPTPCAGTERPSPSTPKPCVYGVRGLRVDRKNVTGHSATAEAAFETPNR